MNYDQRDSNTEQGKNAINKLKRFFRFLNNIRKASVYKLKMNATFYTGAYWNCH